ncbi:homeodomain protein 2 [Rhizopogon salebrosus TDB-379]|nr:homeodomain protein 2 [Rhizopogon salebrosus TDB-379]
MTGMTSVDSVLKQIMQHVQKCLTHPSISTSSRSLASQSPSPRHAIIALPDPPPMQPALITAGAHPEISLEMEKTYQKRAADLRAHYQSAVTVICSNQAQYPSKYRYAPEQKVLSVFTELYLRQLASWREEGVALYLQRASAGDSARTSSCTPKFNHEYVPLLEHFFAENPFPTHADKAFLAKKSAMTYRQIHVWFQNRRNRIKKEGQVLKKKPVAEGATLPLDTLYQRMEKFIVPEGKEVHTSHPCPLGLTMNEEDEMSSVADSGHNPLEPLAPSHAFPSTYPPSCSYDPFPSRNGVTNFGTPKWLRRPMNTPVQHAPLDIDAFIDQFSRVDILDDSSSRVRGKGDSFAAVAAITVIPPSAPHPALIRGMVADVTAVCGILRAVPATASRRHVFNTPSPQSRPVTLIPTSETPTTQKTRRRKVAPLPKRVPHGNPTSHREVTPAMSEASVASPSPSSPSRSSSFGSDGSSQSRLFSSVSSGSSTSSNLATPPSSSPSLPTQLASPSMSLFNFSSSMADLFGDALQRTPTPVEGLQLDFNSNFWGNSRIQKSPTFDFSFNAPPAANLVRTPS